MRVIREDHPIGRGDVAGVELTRRNLQVLLDKLDSAKEGYDTFATIVKDGVFITGVEDEEHYSDRVPGPMLVRGVWK